MIEESGKYFGFSAGLIEAALPIEKVLKVVPLPELKYLPNLPEFIIGLLNYHGEIFPVFDLRIKFNLEERDLLIDHKILLGRDGTFRFGILVTGIIGNIEGNSLTKTTDENLKVEDDLPGEYIHYKDNLIYLSDPQKFLLESERVKLDSVIQNEK